MGSGRRRWFCCDCVSLLAFARLPHPTDTHTHTHTHTHTQNAHPPAFPDHAQGACPTGAGPGPKKDPKNPWPGTCGAGLDKGKGKNAFTSGFEGPWTTTPTRWSNE